MTTEATAPMTRRDLETKIIVKAWEDEGFRARFLTEPKAMFEERLGVKLPEALTITAHAEDAGHLHLVIPAKPDIDMDELSDEDLERIAGGTSVIASAVASATAAFTFMASVIVIALTVGVTVSVSIKGLYDW